MRKGLFMLWSCALFNGVAASAAGSAELSLIVRVNNLAGFDRATVARAEEIAAELYRDAGVLLQWREGGAGASDLNINVVGIRPANMTGHDNEVGLAALPGDGRRGFLAWVFQPTLEEIVENAQFLTEQRVRSVLLAVVLGHVIAHEIGHLLLGSAGHAGAGVMSLGWDLEKLRLACTGRLRFSAKEARKIGAAVATFNRAPVGA